MTPHRPSRRPLALAAVLAVLAAACGGQVPEAPTGSPAGAEIDAEGIAFSPATLVMPAGTPIHIVFRNRDEGVPHGLVIATRTSGVVPRELGRLEISTGPDEREFDLAPLPAGPYLFSCPVHPSMQIEVDVR
jgi:plastocyanin